MLDSQQKYDALLESLERVFPSEPPAVVVEEDWGDYDDAKRAFAEAGANWHPQFVFVHRSTIGFVNLPAFIFLLPHFFRASDDQGSPDPDVFNYVITELKDRVRTNRDMFTEEQKRAVLDVLAYWHALLLNSELDFQDWIADIEAIVSRLSCR